MHGYAEQMFNTYMGTRVYACLAVSKVSSRIFCLGGIEDCVQRSIVCEAYKVFDVPCICPFLSINHQCTKKNIKL